jgi:GNAT superfamily N-acetyltransferase
MPDTETIRRISVEETYPLRHRILRPNQTLADCAYPLDKAPGTYHVGYFLNDNLIGIGTVLKEAQDGSTDQNVWRIRGMAVSSDLQGRGIGGKILMALIRYAASQGLPGEIWCNGRITAQKYQRSFPSVVVARFIAQIVTYDVMIATRDKPRDYELEKSSSSSSLRIFWSCLLLRSSLAKRSGRRWRVRRNASFRRQRVIWA